MSPTPPVAPTLVSKLAEKMRRNHDADVAAYRKAVHAAAAGDTLSARAVDDLAELLVRLGLTAAEFDQDAQAVKAHAGLAAAADRYPTGEAADRDEREHAAKVARLRETIEQAQKELRVAVAGYEQRQAAAVTSRQVLNEHLRAHPRVWGTWPAAAARGRLTPPGIVVPDHVFEHLG